MIELTPEVILVSKAKRFAIEAHGDQMYAKYPYEHHLQGVADLVQKRNKGSESLHIMLAVAWLHDVLEDTDATLEDLVAHFGETVARAVYYLTKQSYVPYDVYLTLIKRNPISCEVKKCDTMFNLYTSFKGNRVKGIKKYSRQLSILEE